MNIKCLFGSHQWNGCKCERCEKIRDEGHNFVKVFGNSNERKCKICGDSENYIYLKNKIKEDSKPKPRNIYKCCKCGSEYDLTGVYVVTLDPCPRCGGYLDKK